MPAVVSQVVGCLSGLILWLTASVVAASPQAWRRHCGAVRRENPFTRCHGDFGGYSLRTLAQKEAQSGFDHSAPKRRVNLNLNSDLVEQCRSGVRNLSAHVEELLAVDLERRHCNIEREKQRTEQVIDALAALYHEHGSLSEEMQIL
jgi:post-segregation antitoxin CcdA